MKIGKPKVSIGMPVYNGEKYIKATLEGLLAQTFKNFELLISDNASTDMTSDICNSYAALDSRIKYWCNSENIGGTANFNKVLASANGEYFMWASHDDLHAENYLEKCVSVLDRDASTVLCHSRTAFIDSEDELIDLINHEGGPLQDSAGNTLQLAAYDSANRLNSTSPHKRLSDMLSKPYVCVNSLALMRTAAIRKTPGFQLYFGSDRVLLMELALMGRFYEVDDHLFSWRIHPEQATRQQGINRQQRMAPKKTKHPRFQFLQGYWRAIWRVPLSFSERIRCLAVLARHYSFDRLPQWRSKGLRQRQRTAAHGQG